MANRAFVQGKGFLEKGMCTLYCNVVLGATGAVTSFTGQGVKSVTRNSAGNYTVVMQDNYVLIKNVTSTLRGTASTGTPTAAKAALVIPYNPLPAAAGGASFQLQAIRSDTMAAADATDRWFLDLTIEAKDSLV